MRLIGLMMMLACFTGMSMAFPSATQTVSTFSLQKRDSAVAIAQETLHRHGKRNSVTWLVSIGAMYRSVMGMVAAYQRGVEGVDAQQLLNILNTLAGRQFQSEDEFRESVRSRVNSKGQEAWFREHLPGMQEEVFRQSFLYLAERREQLNQRQGGALRVNQQLAAHLAHQRANREAVMTRTRMQEEMVTHDVQMMEAGRLNAAEIIVARKNSRDLSLWLEEVEEQSLSYAPPATDEYNVVQWTHDWQTLLRLQRSFNRNAPRSL